MKLSAFMRKELMEYIRTYKFPVLMTIFIIFGIMSPMLAKFMPELMKSLLDAETLKVFTPAMPSAIDSYNQFFKNVTQMGYVALVLVFSGTLANEINSGTLIPLLSKGLSRTNIMISKLISATIVWTTCYAVCFLITYLYTIFIFPASAISNLFLAVIGTWLFGVLLISVLLFASSFLTAGYGALLIVVIFVTALFTINIFPMLQIYNPIVLMSDNVSILQSSYDSTHIIYPFIITIALIILFSTLGCLLFKKRIL